MLPVALLLALARFLVDPAGPTMPSATSTVEDPFWFASPVRAPRSWLSHTCALLPFDHGVLPGPRSKDCTLIRHVRLGEHAGSIWHSTLARHTLIQTQADDTANREFSDLELVLFREPTNRTSGLKAVARLRAPEDIVRDLHVDMVGHSAGVLLGVLTCWNGTAGCAQRLHLFRNNRWRELPVVEALLESRMRELNLVAASDSVRLGPVVVDLRTLEGTVGLFRPREGGCCPSSEAFFQLRLNTGGFALTKLSVVGRQAGTPMGPPLPTRGIRYVVPIQRDRPRSEHLAIMPKDGGHPLVMAVGDSLALRADRYTCRYDVCTRARAVSQTAWRSSSKSIAISTRGMVRASRPGRYTILAAQGRRQARDSIRVLPPIRSLQWTPHPRTLLVGDTLRIAVLALDSSGAVIAQLPISEYFPGASEVVSFADKNTTVLRVIRPGPIVLVGRLAHRIDTLRLEAVPKPDR